MLRWYMGRRDNREEGTTRECYSGSEREREQRGHGDVEESAPEQGPASKRSGAVRSCTVACAMCEEARQRPLGGGT